MAHRPSAPLRGGRPSAPLRSGRPAPRVRQRPNLRVVAGEGQDARRNRPSAVPIVIVAIVVVFGVTGIRAAIGADGLKSSSLERQYAHVQEQHTLLRAQVAQLSAPGRIADEAKKLGLVPAGSPRYLRLPSDAKFTANFTQAPPVR